MSDLLNSASLVMIPSGYKEDVVYSQIPTSGAGDLSFTRASNGTRINSAGLVEVVAWNLLQQSESFDVSPWTKSSGVTISANSVIAPNGTTTADVITFNGSNRDVQQVIAVTNGVFSFYAKGSGTIFVGIASATQTQTEFTLTSDWSRIEVPFTGTSSSVFIGNYSTTATSITLWGAQLNIGSTAKPYFPTTDRLNVPRLTYQNGGGGCPSLLLEKQSTNDLVYSEQFDNAGWLKEAATSTANQTTSPDGTQNADTFIDDSVNSRHIFYQQFNGNLATARTFSLYAKQNSLRYLFMSVTNTGDSHCYSAIFDLQSGTVSATKVNGDATISATIVSTGNGWYRCIISGTMTTGTANYFPLIGTSNRAGFTGSLYAGNTPEYSGSGQSIYLWGAQLEASSYPTSYIPTTSSSATRVADACFKTGISSLIGQSQGTLFLDFVWNGHFTTYQSIEIFGNSNNRIGVYTFDSLNTIRWFIVGSGSVPFEQNISSALVIGQRYKMAIAYKSGDSISYINGSQTFASSATFSFNNALNDFYFQLGSGVDPFYQPVSQTILFPTRLTNAELASLTTL